MRVLPSDTISKLPRIEQTQAALNDQLFDLSYVADRLGLYDAADYLRSKTSNR
jgi:hypothetical protein